MSTVSSEVPGYDRDDYDLFLSSIQRGFDRIEGPLFTTDVKDLFDTFLSWFDTGPERQHYTCHACRRFVERYGGLVTITSNGSTIPAMWPADVPEFYRPAVDACCSVVASAKVTGTFLDKGSMWGQPETGEWHHMHVNPGKHKFHKTIRTAHQVMAEMVQDMKTLSAGLREFSPEVVDQAVTLLKTDSLYRSQKCLGVAEWLQGLHRQQQSTKNSRRRRNLLWLAVATAPAGFCHVRSTMIGTLLEDLSRGMDFSVVKHRFSDKMHPLQYQRPQALPSKGNVAQAEKIVEQLGSAGALRRRFARLDEVQLVWVPSVKDVAQNGEGVFGGIQTKEQQMVRPARVSSQRMTWVKFRDTVLPDAQEISFFVRRGRLNFSAYVTAADMDAPPILQWDTEEYRNPFSWYVYHGGSPPSGWNILQPGWIPVEGISLQPSMWQEGFSRHGESVLFILRGCRDSRRDELSLFPEMLKSDYHGIRATIEAYSKSHSIEDAEGQLASGIRLQNGGRASDYRLLVKHTGNVEAEYIVDRWD